MDKVKVFWAGRTFFCFHPALSSAIPIHPCHLILASPPSFSAFPFKFSSCFCSSHPPCQSEMLQAWVKYDSGPYMWKFSTHPVISKCFYHICMPVICGPTGAPLVRYCSTLLHIHILIAFKCDQVGILGTFTLVRAFHGARITSKLNFKPMTGGAGKESHYIA